MWNNYSLFSAVHQNVISKRWFYVIWNCQNPEKNDNFGKSSKFPGIPDGNFRDRRFPVALHHMKKDAGLVLFPRYSELW